MRFRNCEFCEKCDFEIVNFWMKYVFLTLCDSVGLTIKVQTKTSYLTELWNLFRTFIYLSGFSITVCEVRLESHQIN